MLLCPLDYNISWKNVHIIINISIIIIIIIIIIVIVIIIIIIIMIMIIIILRNSNRNFLFSSSLKRKDSGALYSNFKPILGRIKQWDTGALSSLLKVKAMRTQISLPLRFSMGL